MLINHRFSTRTHTEDGDWSIGVWRRTRNRSARICALSLIYWSSTKCSNTRRRKSIANIIDDSEGNCSASIRFTLRRRTQRNERMGEGDEDARPSVLTMLAKSMRAVKIPTEIQMFSFFYVSFLRFRFCLFCLSLSATKSLQTVIMYLKKWSRKHELIAEYVRLKCARALR